MKHQLAVVEVGSGNDRAVYLDGQYILDVDIAAGDSLDALETVTRSLSQIFAVEPETIHMRDVDLSEAWDWGEVRSFLVAAGLLSNGSALGG